MGSSSFWALGAFLGGKWDSSPFRQLYRLGAVAPTGLVAGMVAWQCCRGRTYYY